MKIIIAKDAGYCFGVRDAVDLAYKTANEHGEVYMLGDIVHNENVVSDLDKSGAKVVNELSEIPTGDYMHYIHHKYFECNYSGGNTSFLDKLMGTFHDGSEEATKEVMARIKDKAHYL